jgi:hypothetical protein
MTESESIPDKIEPSAPTKIPFWRLVFDQGVVTQEIIDHPYPGSGTDEDPYAVTWIANDPRNPMNFSELRKWTLTALVAIATLSVSLVSSAYTGGIQEIMMQFHIGQEVATLGVSLFVLGFAVRYRLPRRWLSSLRNLLCMYTNVICFDIDRTVALGSIE